MMFPTGHERERIAVGKGMADTMTLPTDQLYAYTDASPPCMKPLCDCAECAEQRGDTGGNDGGGACLGLMTLLNTAPMMWRANIEYGPVGATFAEVTGQHKCCMSLVAPIEVMEDLFGVKQNNTHVLIDCQPAMDLCLKRFPTSARSAAHMPSELFSIRRFSDENERKLIKVDTDLMLADILTKNLCASKHRTFSDAKLQDFDIRA